MTTSTEQPRQLQRGRIPDFFVVGQHKSGTTALYEMLRRHPQIFMPDVKEPRFFASDLRPLMGSDAGLPDTFEDYAALFEPAAEGQRVGEASPSYLRSRVAAALIAEANPDARIIAILRDPATLVRSLHLQLLKEHVETETDLRKAVAFEQAIRGGVAVRRYSDHVKYVEQLRRYDTTFPAEQLLVLIYDDFRLDNAATIRTVLRFLDVDSNAATISFEANPSVRLRSRRLDGLLRALYAGDSRSARVATAMLRTLLPKRLRGEPLAAMRRRVLYGRPAEADEDVMRELRVRFKGEVVALSEYLGRDLVNEWGYDRVE